MRNKLERIIFYIFLLAVPFQTRIILKSWGEGFNEWHSAFLYGTDLLLAVLFALWLARVINTRSDFVKTKTSQGRSGYSFCFNYLKQKLCTPRAPRDYYV